jgi:hypothetical protein
MKKMMMMMMMPGAGLIVPFPAIEFYLWAILLAYAKCNDNYPQYCAKSSTKGTFDFDDPTAVV